MTSTHEVDAIMRRNAGTPVHCRHRARGYCSRCAVPALTLLDRAGAWHFPDAVSLARAQREWYDATAPGVRSAIVAALTADHGREIRSARAKRAAQ